MLNPLLNSCSYIAFYMLLVYKILYGVWLIHSNVRVILDHVCGGEYFSTIHLRIQMDQGEITWDLSFL